MEYRETRKAMRPPKGEGTFVVHCSSSLYQPFFQDFIRRQIGIEHYGLLALPGGVQSLTLAQFLPKFAWSGWRHIKFLTGVDSPSRVLLLGHDDCRWYHRGPIAPIAGPERPRHEQDLRVVAREWRERYPGTDVEMYYAHLERGHPVFDAVH